MQVRSLGQEDTLEVSMAIYSSIFAWESYGQRILAGYSPQGCRESDTTEETVLLHTGEPPWSLQP